MATRKYVRSLLKYDETVLHLLLFLMTAIGVSQSISKQTGTHPKMRNTVSLQKRCTCHRQSIHPDKANRKTSQKKYYQPHTNTLNEN